jgi:nicotinate-nucleotide adenylyltransferase
MSAHQRLGVLGGTFDPLHLGHFRAAESTQEAMALDRILFVPARMPPHKARPGITAAEDRFRMIQAAVDNEPAFDVSRVEVDRDGPSFTVDTLAEIKRTSSAAEIFFITGIDSFREIQTWKRWEEMLESFSFIVHGRPGYGLAAAHEAVPEPMRSMLVTLRDGAEPPSGYGPAIYLIQAVTLNISSTEIRAMVRAGRSVRYLVPPEVEAYISKYHLYKEGA